MRSTSVAAALAAAIAVAPSARAQQTELGTYVEVPAEGSSTFTATVGSAIGIAAIPDSYRLGLDYEFGLNGPLLLDVGGAVGLAGNALDIHLAPGAKYLLPMEGLAWVPYGKATLAIDLMGGDAAERNIGLGIKLAGGLSYWFLREAAVGAELGFTTGIATGGGDSIGAFALDALVTASYRLP